LNYLENLPDEYSVHFEKRAYLANEGILYIKTPNHRKIFFKYTLNAVVDVYQPRAEIKKGTPLSVLNMKKHSIILDKFRAMPLQEIEPNAYQARHHIKTGKTITKRDITGLTLVKRGSVVNVSLQNGAISISFSAKAVQDGKLGDKISVVQSNEKKMRAVVVGKNRAEVK
jgi:flagella basal body P-ring formation protein FlgA